MSSFPLRRVPTAPEGAWVPGGQGLAQILLPHTLALAPAPWSDAGPAAAGPPTLSLPPTPPAPASCAPPPAPGQLCPGQLWGSRPPELQHGRGMQLPRLSQDKPPGNDVPVSHRPLSRLVPQASRVLHPRWCFWGAWGVPCDPPRAGGWG